MRIGAEYGFDGVLNVAHVVHRIKDAEHIDTVDHATLDKLIHYVIGIMPVAQDILAAKQHLLGRVGHGGFQQAQSFPGIFAQIADTGIKGRAAPGLNRPITDLVELFANRQHVFDAQPGCQNGLMSITQNDFGDT